MMEGKCILLVGPDGHGDILIRQLEQNGFRVVRFSQDNVCEVAPDLVFMASGKNLSCCINDMKHLRQLPHVVWADPEGPSCGDLDPNFVEYIPEATPVEETARRIERHLATCETILALRGELSESNHRETSLLKANERLLQIHATAGVGILDWDLVTDDISLSEQVQKIYGLASGEQITTTALVEKYVHPSDLEFVESSLEKALSGEERYCVDHRVIRPDGKVVWVNAQADLVTDKEGIPKSLLGTVYDITDRKRAEEALRQSEEKYRVLFETMDQGVVVYEANGEISSANKAAERILGLNLEQIQEKRSIDPLGKRIQEDGSAFPKELYPSTLALQEGCDVRGVIMGMYNQREEAFRWICMDAVPQIKDEKPHRAYIIFNDITQLKEAEEKRLSYERQVQRAQKMEGLGILAGGIAHDFNNLLVGVMGNADLARADLDEDSSAYERISDVIKASRRAADLARQMLAYSGQGRFDLKPVSLDDLVREMMGLLEVAISKRVKAGYSFDVGPAMFHGDATQIRQIIMNLITNASEAVAESSGFIEVDTGIRECNREFIDTCLPLFDRGKQLIVSEGTYTYLQVRDNGRGMDDETQLRIFDPFFSTKFTGRGLGLATVLGIVRGHHGLIKINSELGKGTVFQVLFPVVDATSVAALAKPRVKKKDTWHGSGNILLADDEESVLDVASCMLARMGFETLTATNGQEVIELFRKHADKISCVVLDFTMPDMNGVQAFHEIRSISDQAKVVLSSGFNQNDICKGLDLDGLAGFIQKPYETASLRNCLRKLLGDGE